MPERIKTSLSQEPSANIIPPDPRRRRAHYRATHRGTKEMDWLLGRFATAHLAQMTAKEFDLFEELLALADPELEAMIMRPDSDATQAYQPLIEKLRHFHGLDQ